MSLMARKEKTEMKLKEKDRVKFRHWQDDKWIIIGEIISFYEHNFELMAVVLSDSGMEFRVNYNRLDRE